MTAREAAERIMREFDSLDLHEIAAIIEQAMQPLRDENAELLTALKDAIRRPLGVVPASAEKFLKEGW